ncbi:MAG: response regulator [Myxococcales bacterium]|nr:response regulator [Myxococcales bacterium]
MAKLLVVDDHPDNRDLLARRLARRGHEVSVAADGAEALHAIETDPPDAVLLDLHMPGLDGLSVLSQVRQVHSKIEMPVLMVTAETDSAMVVRAIQSGANDYVTKPIDFPVMLARVESQLMLKAEAPRSTEVVLRSDELREGDMIDGRYRVESLIGEGGFAVVYKALQVKTNRPVAVKLLQTHRLRAGEADVVFARFEQEMRVIGQIRHPNIVRLLDSGRIRFARRHKLSAATQPGHSPGRLGGGANKQHSTDEATAPYLVMEYLEGETLAARLERIRTMTVDQTLRMMLPVLSAVGAAHAQGIVHRDLKPHNIFLVRGQRAEQPCVLDFGVAKLVDQDSDEITVESSAVIGTPEYMSPEQALGRRDVAERSDQYTIAVVLYQCLTGQSPYAEDESLVRLLNDVAFAKFRRPREINPDLPLGLEEVLLKAMAEKPENRYPDVGELGRALLPFARHTTRSEWSAVLAAMR